MTVPGPTRRFPVAAMALALLAALMLGGCSTLVMMRPQNLTEGTTTAKRAATRAQITGYVTEDGEYHAFKGWVEVRAESVEFHEGRGLWKTPSAASATLRRDQVKMLFVTKTDAGATGGYVVLVLVGGVLVLAALVAAVASSL